MVLRGGFYAAAAYIMMPAKPPVRIGLALLSAALGLLTDYAIAARRRHSALRRYVRTSTGGDGPFSCIITVDESGLSVTQLESTLLRPWTAIREVVDTERGIEFFEKEGYVTLAPARAFATAADRARFLAISREWLDQEGSVAGATDGTFRAAPEQGDSRP